MQSDMLWFAPWNHPFFHCWALIETAMNVCTQNPKDAVKYALNCTNNHTLCFQSTTFPPSLCVSASSPSPAPIRALQTVIRCDVFVKLHLKKDIVTQVLNTWPGETPIFSSFGWDTEMCLKTSRRLDMFTEGTLKPNTTFTVEQLKETHQLISSPCDTAFSCCLSY